MTTEEKIWKSLNKALAKYQLIQNGDNILVALSGGKDSLCMLQMLAQRARIHVPQFTLHAAHIRISNVSYQTDTTYLQEFCNNLQVPLHIINTSIPPVPNDKALPLHNKQKPTCFLCSWQRRKQLFNLAQQINCNKIALGHQQDDIIITSLLNITFQGHFSTMPAILRMRKMPITIIRPLCLCQELDIQQFAIQQNYQKQIKNCPYEHTTNRQLIKQVFNNLQQLNPQARYSIWNALETEQKLTEY